MKGIRVALYFLASRLPAFLYLGKGDVILAEKNYKILTVVREKTGPFESVFSKDSPAFCYSNIFLPSIQ
jgi:hypothetical protein